jgi:hypothetical protein
MVKINLLFLFAFLIPVFLASDQKKDPFFEIFEIQKQAEVEPSNLKEHRDEIANAKAFFVKEFNETKIGAKSLEAQKTLLLEYFRIRLDEHEENSAIKFLSSRISLLPLGAYLDKNAEDWTDAINDFYLHFKELRTFLPFLLTPSEYDEFLGLFKDVKEDQKQAIIDNIQGTLQGSKIWDNDCCSALANCDEIVKMKDEFLKKRAALKKDIAKQQLRAETSSILAPIRKDFGEEMDDESFGKVSETIFNFLFCFHFSNLEIFSKKALSDLIFFDKLEDEPADISEDLKAKVDSSEESLFDLIFFRSSGKDIKDISGEDLLRTKLNFHASIKKRLKSFRDDLINLKLNEDKSVTEFLQTLNKAMDLVKAAIFPKKPTIPNPDTTKPPQVTTPPATPGRGKFIAAICLIIFVILAAAGAGLLLYRRQRKI